MAQPLPTEASPRLGRREGALAPCSHGSVQGPLRARKFRLSSPHTGLWAAASRGSQHPPCPPCGDRVLEHGVRGGAGVVAVEEQSLVHPSDAAACPEVVVEQQQVLGHALWRGGCSPQHSTVRARPRHPVLRPRGGEAAELRVLSPPGSLRSQPADDTPSRPSPRHPVQE